MKKPLIIGVLAVAASVAQAKGTNLLTNPGFEEGLKAWARPSKAFKIVDGVGFNGSKGLVWESVEETKETAMTFQRIRLEPGYTYYISALVKVESLNKPKKLTVSLEFSNTSGWAGALHMKPVEGELPGGWVRYELTTPMMPGNVTTGMMLAIIGSSAVGRVIFDDYELVRLGEPKAANFLVSSAYRDEISSGKVRFFGGIGVSTNKMTVRLSYLDAKGRRVHAAPVKLRQDRALFELDAARLLEGRQKIAVEVLGREDGKVIDATNLVFTRSATLPKRRIRLDSRRRMWLDGKKFFPLGEYTYSLREKDVEWLAKSPFNFIMNYGGVTTNELKWCRDAGLYVAGDVRTRIWGWKHAEKRGVFTYEDTKRELTKLYSEIGSDPTIIAWYVNDEGPVGIAPNTARANALLKELDPDRPTFVVEAQHNIAANFLPAADVIALDRYPVGHYNKNRTAMESVTKELRLMDADQESLHTLWSVPQTFDWSVLYGEKDKKNYYDPSQLRMPTKVEMANMFFQSIACGANGILGYCFSDFARRKKGDELQKCLDDLFAAAAEVKKMEDVILSDDFPVLPQAGVPEFVPVRAWRRKDVDWYLVVNAKREDQTATVRLRKKAKMLRTAIGEGVKLSADGLSLECAFAPLGYAFVGVK